MKIEPVYRISFVETYRKYKDIAVVDEKTFRNRMSKENWTIEKALLTPKMYEKMSSWRSVAIENGISLETYRSRVKAGWDKEDAATTPPYKKAKPKTKMKGDIERILLTPGFGWASLSKKQKQYVNDNPDLFKGVL